MSNPLKSFTALALLLSLSACQTVNPELVSDSKLMTKGTGTPVLASMETKPVGTANMDAADDPEVYVSPLGEAVILATDKKAGLYVFNLDGSVRDFNAAGPLNNVDLRVIGNEVWIGATDRTNNGVALFGFSKDLKLERHAFVPIATSEAYGFCMGVLEMPPPIAGQAKWKFPVAVAVGKNGDVALSLLGEGLTGAYPQDRLNIKRFEVGTQSEGCVIDDKTSTLYIAEENVGIWAYPLGDWAKVGQGRVQLAVAPSDALKPDVEGLTLLREGSKTYLIASSQGDSAFAIWQVEGAQPVYKGRFSVYPGNGIDAVTGTDGVAALGGAVGPYAEGVVVMQDDADTDGEAPSTVRARQNFKLVDWREIKKALGL